ncbi:Asp23/Gls24 family envelope stress response protein [Pseudonocardia endophytica]|uniref:Putative alkaline shock family protein YloU n=1 Tax=Pseudonocardia endophytica TaxID=401976 RepID=A0A4R1HU33_PSEEN|nr:Asp23/Gls24 family envelope stress response protein [Pseudonocardia endophytica]TCK24911.1 putative alkaline shock family protein YloU [Pseudonocardia endophytica]
MTVTAVDEPAPSSLAEPESRGTLEIDPGVLRKIVEHAADQAPGTRHRTRTVAGLGVGESRPTARISAFPDGIDVQLRVTLAYPAPIRETVADVRERIARDLDRIAGQTVRSLTVDVGALQSDREPDEPRVR